MKTFLFYFFLFTRVGAVISRLTSQKLAITVADVLSVASRELSCFSSVAFSPCYTVHVHVHQMMIISTGDPSSIQLKENRARTGHFAAQQR